MMNLRSEIISIHQAVLRIEARITNLQPQHLVRSPINEPKIQKTARSSSLQVMSDSTNRQPQYCIQPVDQSKSEDSLILFNVHQLMSNLKRL